MEGIWSVNFYCRLHWLHVNGMQMNHVISVVLSTQDGDERWNLILSPLDLVAFVTVSFCQWFAGVLVSC